ncbi:MAG: ATP-grasp domain-containing protein [bacterium]|nr:ATP-grasp domain-containing protein [bacterium]
MSKIHVAILRGGPSSEYHSSLQTGGSVLKNLSEKYHAHDVFISKDGIWHKDGYERTPARALNHIDVVFNALHGRYSEVNHIQKILDTLGIPYTGSNSMGSLLAMNKVLSKKAFENHKVKTPYFKIIRNDDDIKKAVKESFNSFILPVIVRPASSGTSQGVTLVQNARDIEKALSDAFKYSDTAIIEEHIKGKSASCSVIQDFRGQKTYTLLPVEVREKEVHHNTFSSEEKAEIQWLAQKAHEVLGLRHYSHADFVITPSRGIYMIEVNTLPTLSEDSVLPKSLAGVGCTYQDFLDHILTLALHKK